MALWDIRARAQLPFGAILPARRTYSEICRRHANDKRQHENNYGSCESDSLRGIAVMHRHRDCDNHKEEEVRGRKAHAERVLLAPPPPLSIMLQPDSLRDPHERQSRDETGLPESSHEGDSARHQDPTGRELAAARAHRKRHTNSTRLYRLMRILEQHTFWLALL
ncbi:MAG: hypothetical protein ACYDAE_23040 [Steroidobacteraceae bacterium]